MNTSLLNVGFITYNQVNYVQEALESILMQKTSFPFLIVVADDCSTDGTREVILKYAENYPEKIVLTNPQINLGAEKNFKQLLTKCIDLEPKYIAYLDGDDVWIDPLRLQKQVDYLEHHEKYAMVYGNYDLIDKSGNKLPFRNPPRFKSGNVFKDILVRNFSPALGTSLIRTIVLQKIYKTGAEPGVDFYLFLSLTKDHPVAFINEEYLHYRVHTKSITKSQRPYMSYWFLNIIKRFEKESPELVKKGIKKAELLQLYRHVQTEPGVKSILLLFKNFQFSVQHLRHLAKCLVNTVKHK